MDYTISHFTYTQKSTKPILALKLSVSAIITPGGLPQQGCQKEPAATMRRLLGVYALATVIKMVEDFGCIFTSQEHKGVDVF